MPHISRKVIRSRVFADDDPAAEADQGAAAIGLRRNSKIVRVRCLNSGEHPTYGITLSLKALRQSGLDLGDRVYVLVETPGNGRLVIEKVSPDVLRYARRSEAPQPILLRKQERQTLEVELEGLAERLEADAMGDERRGNRRAARVKFNRITRLRYLVRKLR